MLRGGAGRNTFVFALSDLRSSARDRVLDFSACEDAVRFEGVAGLGGGAWWGPRPSPPRDARRPFDDASRTL